MTEEKRYTYDEISDMLSNTQLGHLPDGNTMAGTLSSFINGMMQESKNNTEG